MRKTASQIADEVITKCAYITEEEIARGIAGQRARPISQDEVTQYAQQAQDKAIAGQSNAPAWGAGIGAGLGGLAGALIGKGAGRKIGYGLLGGAAGGALGAGAGWITRGSAGNQARDEAQALGEVARQGRIPHGIASRHLNVLPEYAVGTQDDLAQEYDPEMADSRRRRAMGQGALSQGLQGALLFGLAGDEDNLGRNALVGGAGGAAHGALDAAREAGQWEDLRERGYGHLADQLERQQTYGVYGGI